VAVSRNCSAMSVEVSGISHMNVRTSEVVLVLLAMSVFLW
jgi:hypothetical protein